MFSTSLEHRGVIESILTSAKIRPVNAEICSDHSKSLLKAVDPYAERLRVSSVLHGEFGDKKERRTVEDSWLEIVYPFSTDSVIRQCFEDVHVNKKSVRLGKFYAALDATTADVALRHTMGPQFWLDDSVHLHDLVTAGHYDSVQLHPFTLDADLVMRCYVVAVGRSSVEVRTDVFQEDRIAFFSHTVMVALDKKSKKPVGVPGLDLSNAEALEPENGLMWAKERENIAHAFQRQRRLRRERTSALRTERSVPPDSAEMKVVHVLLQRADFLQRASVGKASGGGKRDPSGEFEQRLMKDWEVSSSIAVYNENRNNYGSLFGGFIAQHAYELAYLTAYAFSGSVPEPLGFDEMLFQRAVKVGDLLRFKARVVYTKGRIMRTLVTVQVVSPDDFSTEQEQTNKLAFIFQQPVGRVYEIIPDSYDEVLMYLEARRWQLERGPDEVLVLGWSEHNDLQGTPPARL